MSKIIKLTDRAFDDLAEIENYSIETWGKKVADKYLDDIEAGLNLLQENSGLLQELENFSGKLKFYRVKNHFLICTELDEFIIVLTIKHVHMDIISQLIKLEPSLKIEVDLLCRRLMKG
jgi:plasmid stabilization system protein ParE